ncbi:MAG: 50S ribosomal protein L19 [Omnitrophica WOR_2 bacterium RIFCSPHIGHO2_02_FULL_48_11]|nr:MAG: 50S ribosomal protein L19 [Omnitrophica WOR_2 bacterium RIFCSPHIGHO2_02_FULL_48_11]
MVSIAETIKNIEKQYLRADLPAFNVGDTVKMKVKVAESDKVRLHPFEGIVIRKTGSGVKSTFTVRKVSFGEGVERTFPIHSPVIESLKVVHKGLVRRAKLYYLRDRVGNKVSVKTDHAEPTAKPAQPAQPAA